MKLKNIILITALTLVSCCFIYAADNPLSNYKYSVKNLLTVFPDAVELNIIFQIFEDKNGFIWFATENGLIRYDGYKLKYFLPDARNKESIGHYMVRCIASDSTGNLWIGLYKKGIDCYNPKTEKFTHYPFDKSGKVDQSTKSICVDKQNQVWAITSEDKLAKLNKVTGTFDFFDVVTKETFPVAKQLVLDTNAKANAQIIDGDNNDLWITTIYGLYNFNKETKQSVAYTTPGLNPKCPVYGLGPIIRKGDLIWTGGWASGLRSFNIKTKEWRAFVFSPFKDILYADNILNTLAVKSENELWLATVDKGLGVFNTITNQFNFFEDNPSACPELNSQTCHHVFQDSQKNLWTWFDNKLLRVVASERYVVKVALPSKKNTGNEFFITDILEESNGKYVMAGTAFADGLYLIERKTGKTESFSFPITQTGENSLKVCRLIEISNSRFWVLTRDMIMLFDLKNKRWLPVKQPPLYGNSTSSNIYVDATLDIDSNLWISLNGPGIRGLLFYNTKTQQSKLISPEDIKQSRYFGKARRIICDKQNRIWFRSTAARMAGYYDINTNTEILLDGNGKLSDAGITSIWLSQGKNETILNATDEGLLIFDVKGKSPVLVKKLDVTDGLKSDMIEYQSQDSYGNIWYKCNEALYRYNLANGKNEMFNTSDELEIDRGNIECGKDSLVYEFARTGFNLLNLNRIKSVPLISKLKLTSFQIDGKEILYNSELDSVNRITVPAGYAYLSFEFANLDFAHTDNITYSYKLEGIDEDWIYSGQRRSASYTNLPGGHYKLIVRCALSNNEWNESVLEIPVYVETALYKTVWFRLFLVVLISLLLLAIYRYRTSQQQAIEDLNNRATLLEKEKSLVQYENLKQQLNPHFLFNSLTSLSSLITTEPKTARQFVEQMSKIYRYILKSNEHEIVPLINEINFATTYVKLQQTRFSKGLEVHINVDEEFNDRKIVPVTIQNMIENAIKHNIIDEDSPLVIDVYVEEEYLIVKNNLQKKSIVESSNKQGLQQMKTLYKYLIDKPILINETEQYYEIKIPLI